MQRQKPVKNHKSANVKKSKVTIISFVILAFLIIISICIYYFLLNKSVNDVSEDISLDVKNAYIVKQPTFTEHIKTEQELISTDVVSGKIGEFETSVCYIRTDGAGGWAIRGYSQVCYDRVLVGYYTNLSKEDISNKITGVKSGNLISERCILRISDSGMTMRYSENNEVASHADVQGHFDYNECGRPSNLRGSESIIAKTLGTELSIKPIKIIDTKDVDENSAQIWIEKDYKYFDQSIKCKSTGLSLLSNCNSSTLQAIQ